MDTLPTFPRVRGSKGPGQALFESLSSAMPSPGRLLLLGLCLSLAFLLAQPPFHHYRPEPLPAQKPPQTLKTTPKHTETPTHTNFTNPPCLVSRWSATWTLDAQHTRRFVRFPTDHCLDKARPLQQSELEAIPKARDDDYTLSKEQSADACRLSACASKAAAASTSMIPSVVRAIDTSSTSISSLTSPLQGSKSVPWEAAAAFPSSSTVSSSSSAVSTWMHRSGLRFNHAGLVKFSVMEPQPGDLLLVVFGGASVSEMLRNWEYHVRRQRITYVVACMDESLFNFSDGANMPAVMHTNASQDGGEDKVQTRWKYYRMDPKAFLTMGLLKVRFFVSFLRAGFDVLCSDLDVIWLGDPKPWLSGTIRTSNLLPFADVIVSVDVTTGEQENDKHAWGTFNEMNTGVIFLRATNGSLVACAAWTKRMQEELIKVKSLSSGFLQWWTNDQTFFNEVMHKAKRDLSLDPKTQVLQWLAHVRSQASSDSMTRREALLGGIEKLFLEPILKNRTFTKEESDAFHGMRNLNYRLMACDGIVDGCSQEKKYPVALSTFPYVYFASGHTYFTQSLQQRLGITPVAVHTTFQFGDTPEFTWGKRNRLRERQLWVVDKDDYYTRRGGGADAHEVEYEGFITVTGQLVPHSALSLIRDEASSSIKLEGNANYSKSIIGHMIQISDLGENNPNRHLLLDALQRRLVLNLVALGRATRRKVVMPRMTCWCDRYWWLLEGCRFPGVSNESQPLPFHCPFDHLYDLEKWVHSDVPMREYSFMDNPRVNESDARDRVALHVEGIPASANVSRAIRIPVGSSYADVAALLKTHRTAGSSPFLVEVDARSLELLCEDLGSVQANTEFNDIIDTVLGVAEQIRYCDRKENPWFNRPTGPYDFNKYPINCTWGFHRPPLLPEEEAERTRCTAAKSDEVAQLRNRELQRDWTQQPNRGMYADYSGLQMWSTKKRVRDLFRKYV